MDLGVETGSNACTSHTWQAYLTFSSAWPSGVTHATGVSLVVDSSNLSPSQQVGLKTYECCRCPNHTNAVDVPEAPLTVQVVNRPGSRRMVPVPLVFQTSVRSNIVQLVPQLVFAIVEGVQQSFDNQHAIVTFLIATNPDPGRLTPQVHCLLRLWSPVRPVTTHIHHVGTLVMLIYRCPTLIARTLTTQLRDERLRQ